MAYWTAMTQQIINDTVARVVSSVVAKPEDVVMLIGFDIESTGARAPMDHDVVAVGFCICLCLPWNPQSVCVADRRRYTIKVQNEDRFEERCKREFWDMVKPEVRDALLHGADPEHQPVEAGVAFQVMHEYLVQFTTAARDMGTKVMWITDNPAYDAGILNACFAKEHLQPLHLLSGQYIGITDCGEVRRVAKRCFPSSITAPLEEAIKGMKRRTHDHYPENDAKAHVLEYVMGQSWTCSTSDMTVQYDY